ncbi:hypothetical protein QBC32DRAFT_170720 [Pseudoneurospora amorphoporcata]|uniref:Uncharacterized protein n=1 Tax=Pseudoneurospora amorphoporcata TaxID=241081 RepID=A0AAN6NS58_9PEZI|nr:hypothetical protein QBC32DRAFT_170720 [Pseudoneurospora amorphoporcata]
MCSLCAGTHLRGFRGRLDFPVGRSNIVRYNQVSCDLGKPTPPSVLDEEHGFEGGESKRRDLKVTACKLVNRRLTKTILYDGKIPDCDEEPVKQGRSIDTKFALWDIDADCERVYCMLRLMLEAPARCQRRSSLYANVHDLPRYIRAAETHLQPTRSLIQRGQKENVNSAKINVRLRDVGSSKGKKNRSTQGSNLEPPDS